MGWVLTGSSNADVGFENGSRVLRNGGSAIEAVITTIREVEANPDDHSVGYSGLPNLLGDVELDASIMDGRGLRAGSVGALKNHQDAIDLARCVMEELPHVLIVGDGAERFAGEQQLPKVDLLTDEAKAIWLQRADPTLQRSKYYERMSELVRETTSDPQFPEPPHGTVNVIARDLHGNIACGVSTSGWAWKYPGRLGDSPIIGAGIYADNRFGAAACTGRGEMAQRCLTAHSVVTFMRFGMSLEDALRMAAEDLRSLDDPYASEMNIVAIDVDGTHNAVSTSEGKTYIFQTDAMPSPEYGERIHVPLC
ncbi:MAG TPA: N(4)-(beta-N-acetylglucosaminyl)-L-asparaginase [Thermomicrobiales bacterium]|nr:N(4)-(beta-N-acetylglucosaminyl)-L-asparaginase [Thermomicrobiales bacterium]